MEEDKKANKFQKTMKSSKEFISRGYHCFAAFVEKKLSESKTNGSVKNAKMYFAKYVLIILNIFYMLISLLIINVGTVAQFLNYTNNFLWWDNINGMSILWLVCGVVLLCVAIFGMIGAFRESVVWTYIYGVLLTIAFILQISSAIAAFSLISHSRSIAWNGINSLMNDYDYGYISGRYKMDFIQKSFHCCGNDNPTNWQEFGKFRLDYNRGGYYYYHQPSTTTTTVAPELLKVRMPASCCAEDSNYNNLTCDNYYKTGCVGYLREVVSETVLIIGTVSLAIGVAEILGIVLAFISARLMRKTNIYRQVDRYNVLTNDENLPAKATNTNEEDDQMI